MTRGRVADSGFAVIASLWTLLFAAAVAGEYLAESRHLAVVSRNRTVELRADWAALGGLEHVENVVERLLSLRESADLRVRTAARWSLQRLDTLIALGSPLCLDEICVRLQAADARARLNVNPADDRRLRLFLEACGLDSRQAEIVTHSVLDWIDSDDLHRARGAERAHYERWGASRLPRNGPLRSLGELLWVQGVTPEVYARAAPHLTVEGDGRINVNSAPVPVLAALPGLGPTAAQAIAGARARGVVFENPYDVAASLASSERARLSEHFPEFLELAAYEPLTIEVVAESEAPNGPPHVRYRAVYVATGVRAQLRKRWRGEIPSGPDI